jgi:hypothetical protein
MWRGTTFSAHAEYTQLSSKDKKDNGAKTGLMFTATLGFWWHEHIGISSTHTAGLTFAVIYGCTETHMRAAACLLKNSDGAITRDPLLAVGVFAELQRLCTKVVIDDSENKSNVVMYRLNLAGYGRRDVVGFGMSDTVVRKLMYNVVQRNVRMLAEITILKRNIASLAVHASLDKPETDQTSKRIGGRLNEICVELEDMGSRSEADLDAVRQVVEYVSSRLLLLEPGMYLRGSCGCSLTQSKRTKWKRSWRVMQRVTR